jgi:hypothetical protein
MNKLIKQILLPAIFTFSLAILSSCDESGGITVPSGASELTVSIKSDDNVADAVVITEAKALLTNVEFEQESNGKNQLHQKGPIVLNLSLDGTIKEIGTQYIIRDNYTKVKFQLHKPEESENPSDPEFKIGTGATQRFSFIIKGTYNGTGFVYKSKASADLIISFSKTENINLKKNNVTVLFNKTKWFKNGNTDLNPNDPANESLIDNNIKNSFLKAFKDDNKNGVPD